MMVMVMVMDTSLVCMHFFLHPSHDQRYMRQRRHVHMYTASVCLFKLTGVTWFQKSFASRVQWLSYTV
jgi:hypothetical protein